MDEFYVFMPFFRGDLNVTPYIVCQVEFLENHNMFGESESIRRFSREEFEVP